MRRVFLVSVAAPAFLLSGCGGHRVAVFSGADARRLASIAPDAPGWNWPSRTVAPTWDTSAAGPTTDPLLRKFLRQTARLVSLGQASNRWQDANKLGNVDIAVFKDSQDAHASMAPFDTLSQGWAAKSGRVTKAAATTGLGDEAWVMWVAGNGPEVTYHWRRDNLVFEVHVQCFGHCPHNIDRATRAWAHAIDGAAN
jgi:hypothetical protein